ncbi:MAG: hypothetical protein WBE48_22810, partial [Xanthobacteraceae bacterium]
NETQSKNDACSTRRKPHKLKPDEPVTPVNHAAIPRNLSDDGHVQLKFPNVELRGCRPMMVQ